MVRRNRRCRQYTGKYCCHDVQWDAAGQEIEDREDADDDHDDKRYSGKWDRSGFRNKELETKWNMTFI